MRQRQQQTIQSSSELRGYGLFTNAEVRVRFLPAGEHHGIVFQRVDLADKPLIPALVDFLAPEERRTKLVRGAASVEMTEHLLAAFAGLRIDNCLVQIDAPELPGCDGSALWYAEALLNAGIVAQSAPRDLLQIDQPELIEDATSVLHAEPGEPGLWLSYSLDYGSHSPIRPQSAEFQITPETFVAKIASARTFLLEQEIAYLRSRGYGQKVTLQDLLVFGPQGPIENALRAPNECARHKLLDCLGDLALAGCDIQGQIRAIRTGHRHNHELARRLCQAQRQASANGPRRAA